MPVTEFHRKLFRNQPLTQYIYKGDFAFLGVSLRHYIFLKESLTKILGFTFLVSLRGFLHPLSRMSRISSWIPEWVGGFLLEPSSVSFACCGSGLLLLVQ